LALGEKGGKESPFFALEGGGRKEAAMMTPESLAKKTKGRTKKKKGPSRAQPQKKRREKGRVPLSKQGEKKRIAIQAQRRKDG